MKGETKKRRMQPWMRPMKRNEKKAKLKVGDPIQSVLHLKKGVPPNIPHENYTMKEGVRKKGKGKGI
jgi:hypothetical protein